ncbi:DNA modification methylase [Gemmata sp.]|uniref:DNA modification methylase n=1 Tax=Gemmata sp. TaxID=1914242 RepID=UPI003F725AA1
MNVELMQLDRLTPCENNPRRNDGGVDAVAASIREFGWRAPIVVDEHLVIVAGHTRYKAAKKLGLTEVPVHVARGLTPSQARAYRIADNQTATLSQWDDDKLALELVALQQDGFDLSLTGFPEDDVLRMLTAPEPLVGDPDEVPDPPAEPVTKPGDLWVLGRHRLLCGDATKLDDVATALGDGTADVLLTDPPYNVAYEGKTADHLTIANDDLDPAAYRAFLASALKAAGSHLKPGGAFYLFHADLTALPVRLACADAGLTIRQGLVWVKSVLVPGRQDYQWRHEPVLYGWADGAAHTWLSDRSQSTVLEFDKPVKNSDHPTPKPVDLFAYLLGNSCPPGGTVLDPFAGSGTALVAAEQTGRRAALLELDPRYADVIIARYEQLTGKAAERHST